MCCKCASTLQVCCWAGCWAARMLAPLCSSTGAGEAGLGVCFKYQQREVHPCVRGCMWEGDGVFVGLCTGLAVLWVGTTQKCDHPLVGGICINVRERARPRTCKARDSNSKVQQQFSPPNQLRVEQSSKLSGHVRCRFTHAPMRRLVHIRHSHHHTKC